MWPELTSFDGASLRKRIMSTVKQRALEGPLQMKGPEASVALVSL